MLLLELSPLLIIYRFLSGFQDSSLRLPDRSKAAGAAWRALPDAEKKARFFLRLLAQY